VPECDEERERRESERREKIAAMQKLVEAGLKSGIGTRSREELFQAARAALASAEPCQRGAG
jgi:antitoxin ParD1/3/4